MDKDYLKGIKIGLGFFSVCFLIFGLVYAVGFHTANEILGGTFIGNYIFNGSVDFTSSNVTGLNIITNNSLNLGNGSLQYIHSNTGLDSFTKLLISSDTNSGSVSFLDSSTSAHTISVVGQTQHSTTASKFGKTSIYFDGATDYLTMADSSDWAFGTGDFTIDFWIKKNRLGVEEGILGQHIASGNGNPRNVIHLTTSNQIWFYDYNSGVSYTSNTPFADTNWHHIAYVRVSGNLSVYLDGNYDGSVSLPSSTDNGNTMYIGFSMGSSGQYEYFQGYLDEIRISKGVARWTSNFTPPNSAYYQNDLYFTDALNKITKLN